jgi:hypothetical protein
MIRHLDTVSSDVAQDFFAAEGVNFDVSRGECFEQPKVVAKIAANPSRTKSIMETEQRRQERKAKRYSRIVAADAVKRGRDHLAKGAKVAKAVRPALVRVAARAHRSAVSHGGARASGGDDGSGSSSDGPSTAGDGEPPPRPRGRKALDPDLTAAEIRALLDFDPATGIFRWRQRSPDMSDEARP